MNSWMSALVPLILPMTGGVFAGGVALLVSWLNRRYKREFPEDAAAERLRIEKLTPDEKAARERYFIATELVFLLEHFAEECASVIKDFDYTSCEKGQQTCSPVLNYAVVTRDWRALDRRLMYRIRQLRVLQNEADRKIAAYTVRGKPFHEVEAVRERQYQYARLGLKALFLVRRLRKSAGFEETRLNGGPWSAQQVLLKRWHQERKWRCVQAVLFARPLATFEMKNDMRRNAAGDAAAGGPRLPRSASAAG